MSEDELTGEEGYLAGDRSQGTLTDGTVELRMPADNRYLPVLRAAVGVMAGSMSFNYDQIIQLRVAVTEAFDLVSRAAGQPGSPSQALDLVVYLVASKEALEVQIAGAQLLALRAASGEQEESRAVMESLVDCVRIGQGIGGRDVISLLKRHEQ